MINPAKKELFDKIIRIYPTLSPKKKRVADFIIKKHKNLFLMTAKQLAKECQVSEPTVVRFAFDLGFSGYQELSQYMKGQLHLELTRYERTLRTIQNMEKGTSLKKYCRNTIASLEELMSSFSESEFLNAAKAIQQAQHVMVVGHRASATLSYYFGYLLKKIRDKVMMYTHYSWESIDNIALLRESLLLFIIALPRYPRPTIELVEYARNYGTKIIGLSDTPTSPIIAFADHPIVIEMNFISFVDPFAHIMVYLEALIHEIAFMDKEKTIQRLSRIEDGARRKRFIYFSEGTGQNHEGIDLLAGPNSHKPDGPSKTFGGP